MKLLLTVFASLISLFVSAQNLQQGSPGDDSYLSKPESMYVIVMVICILAFIFGIIYTLGRANRMMSKQIEDSI